MRILITVLLCLSLVACGGGPLSLFTGGGPNVAANVQAGQTNTQTVGTTQVSNNKNVVRPNARVDKIDQSTETITNNELPPLVWIIFILLFIVGWTTDTPRTMVAGLRRKK